MNNKYLDILQVFRGVAALTVVFHHNIPAIRYYHGYDNSLLSFIGLLGKYGVDFFFVLSGFIIAYTSSSRLEEKGAISKYLKSRLLRIYTPYLPIGIAIYLLYYLFPSFSNSDRSVSLLTSSTLIPHGRPALSVAWTLSLEVIFYLFYSLRFYDEKLFKIGRVAWICLILCVNFIFPETIAEKGWTFYKAITSFYNVEFFFGIFLSYLFIKRIELNIYLNIIFALLFAFSFIYVRWVNFEFFRFFPNILFALFVMLVVYFSINRMKISLKRTNLFMVIGNASYSIYLVHNNVQAAVVRFFPEISIGLRVFLMISLSLLVSCVVGYIYSLIFEQRITNYFKRKLLE